jgi:hypothetical protein
MFRHGSIGTVAVDLLGRGGRTGRPLGSERVLRTLERRLGRRLAPGRPKLEGEK